MSKMDNLRAMREARYEQAKARAASPAASPVPTAKPKATTVSSPAPQVSEPGTSLCGHRSMNGRTCTREAGHAAKSHRYG
jgi:Tfp pilus assembly protein FimV